MVIAIGQSPSPLISKSTPELAVGKGGVVQVNQNSMKTSKQGVFAGGDIITGGATRHPCDGPGQDRRPSYPRIFATVNGIPYTAN